ncbi:DUF2169 domain-containing protein [Polyangium jinanense]|uniref:DUF2169 domain-containing protein n=1 Tax=Polyangium jinanense TaxID=2829994 RepID=A0A9X4ATB8_9BACT|nr:DUF2169 domain-containing protein [Polyangium jinanense]MDC3982025.1 DUF2169 domain-containing protein [Polyangium jinanense]
MTGTHEEALADAARSSYTARRVEVLSLCPFRAGALIWQAAPGAYSLTVIVKATFTIVPGGEATVTETQVPVTTLAEGGAEDLSPLKPRVDVLVLGATDPEARVAVEGAILPAGGPMPPQAPSRRLLLGDEAYAWAQGVLAGEALAAGPPPEGFEFAFFQCAPREQRIDLLRIAASIGMDRILPMPGRIETRLPQRRPHAFRVDPKGGRVTEIALRCDTLCIDAEQKTMVLTFRGLADLKSGAEADVGKIVVAAHPEGKRIRPERIDRFLRLGESLEEDVEAGLNLLEMRHDAVLIAPKSGDTMVLPEQAEAPPIRFVDPAPPDASQRQRTRTIPMPTDRNEVGLPSLTAALPFRPPPPDPIAAPPLPPPPVSPPSPSPSPKLIAEPLTEDTTLDMPKAAAPPSSKGREIGRRVEPLPDAPAPPPSTGKPATPASKLPIKPPAPLAPRLAKPAGPSAGPPRPSPPRPGPVQGGKVAAPPRVSAPAPAAAPAPAPADPPPSSSPVPFDPASIPIDRCAAVAAELRHRPDGRDALLALNALSSASWASVERHWADAMAQEATQGERRLLLAYDTAYHATQERLGLPVGLAEHARLQVAAERGTTAEVLAELGLEPSDQARLGRVWAERLVDDPRLMSKLAAALGAARAS